VDILRPEQRSSLMSRIRGKDTRPELSVRRNVHRLDFRFRLHRRDLPGSPDLVFPRLHKIVFVHGCFWHRHPGCRYAYTPKSNIPFWRAKFDANVARDGATQKKLRELGWQVLTLWECETEDEDILAHRLASFLGKDVREAKGGRHARN